MKNNVLLCVTETAHVKRNKTTKQEKRKRKKGRRQQPASIVQQLSIKKKKCLRTIVNRIYKCVVQTSKKKQRYSWKKSMLIVKAIY
jgi:hypothetical protein